MLDGTKVCIRVIQDQKYAPTPKKLWFWATPLWYCGLWKAFPALTRTFHLVEGQWWAKKLNKPNALDINASIDSKRNNGSAGELVTKETCSSKWRNRTYRSSAGTLEITQFFRSDFKHAIEARYIKRDVITILRTCLKLKPLYFIKGTGSDYETAWEYLDSIYEDPRFVSDTITQAIVKFRSIRDGEDARFCDLVRLMRRCYNTLKERRWFAKRYELEELEAITLR